MKIEYSLEKALDDYQNINSHYCQRLINLAFSYEIKSYGDDIVEYHQIGDWGSDDPDGDGVRKGNIDIES